jgi:hypothetical protein
MPEEVVVVMMMMIAVPHAGSPTKSERQPRNQIAE